MSKLLTTLVAVTFIGTSFSAIAADDMKMKEGKMGMMDMHMDTDKNGMISESEMMAMFKKMDKNGDGMLDAKEHKMMMSGGMMKDDKMMHDGMKKGDKMTSDGMKHDGMKKDDKMMDGMKK